MSPTRNQSFLCVGSCVQVHNAWIKAWTAKCMGEQPMAAHGTVEGTLVPWYSTPLKMVCDFLPLRGSCCRGHAVPPPPIDASAVTVPMLLSILVLWPSVV